VLRRPHFFSVRGGRAAAVALSLLLLMSDKHAPTKFLRCVDWSDAKGTRPPGTLPAFSVACTRTLRSSTIFSCLMPVLWRANTRRFLPKFLRCVDWRDQGSNSGVLGTGSSRQHASLAPPSCCPGSGPGHGADVPVGPHQTRPTRWSCSRPPSSAGQVRPWCAPILAPDIHPPVPPPCAPSCAPRYLPLLHARGMPLPTRPWYAPRGKTELNAGAGGCGGVCAVGGLCAGAGVRSDVLGCRYDIGESAGFGVECRLGGVRWVRLLGRVKVRVGPGWQVLGCVVKLGWVQVRGYAVTVLGRAGEDETSRATCCSWCTRAARSSDPYTSDLAAFLVFARGENLLPILSASANNPNRNKKDMIHPSNLASFLVARGWAFKTLAQCSADSTEHRERPFLCSLSAPTLCPEPDPLCHPSPEPFSCLCSCSPSPMQVAPTLCWPTSCTGRPPEWNAADPDFAALCLCARHPALLPAQGTLRCLPLPYLPCPALLIAAAMAACWEGPCLTGYGAGWPELCPLPSLPWVYPPVFCMVLARLGGDARDHLAAERAGPQPVQA